MSIVASIILITNLAFNVAWDDETRCPAWVSWDVEPHEVVKTNRLHVSFRADDRVHGSDLANDYTGSGYDRGHMAPAADFNFDLDALKETYLFTNVCPQDPSVNRGLWSAFESEVRNLAKSGTVHVVCWPEYDTNERGMCSRIGRVAVPSAFVKVAYGWFGVRCVRVNNFTVGRSDGDVKTKGKQE